MNKFFQIIKVKPWNHGFSRNFCRQEISSFRSAGSAQIVLLPNRAMHCPKQRFWTMSFPIAFLLLWSPTLPPTCLLHRSDHLIRPFVASMLFRDFHWCLRFFFFSSLVSFSAFSERSAVSNSNYCGAVIRSVVAVGVVVIVCCCFKL